MEYIYLGAMLGSVVYVSIFSGISISRTRKAIKEKRLLARSTLVRTKRFFLSFVIMFMAVAILAAISDKLLFAFIWLFNSFIWHLSYKKHKRLIVDFDRLEDLKAELKAELDILIVEKELSEMTDEQREKLEEEVKTTIDNHFNNKSSIN